MPSTSWRASFNSASGEGRLPGIGGRSHHPADADHVANEQRHGKEGEGAGRQRRRS